MRIYFHHIIKTAGSSFRSYLVDRLGERNVSPPLRNARYREAMRDYSHFAAIAGHVVVDPGDELHKDRLSVVFLRDPIERVLSQFSFTHTTHQYGRNPRSPAVDDVDEWLNMLSERETRALNAQLDCIWGFGWSDPGKSPSMQQKIEAAKRALEQFDVVGLQEHFAESTDMFARRCGWEPPHASPRANVTPARLARVDISDEALGRMRRFLQPDYDVYHHALMLFGRQQHAATHNLRTHSAPSAAISAESSAAVAADARVDNGQEREDDGPSTRASVAGDADERRMSITGVSVKGQISGPGVLQVGETVAVEIRFESRVSESRLTLSMSICDHLDTLLFGTNTRILGENLAVTPGAYIATFRFANHLGLGSYRVTVALHRDDSQADGCFDRRTAAAQFEVVDILTEDFIGKVHLCVDASVVAASPTARLERTPSDASGDRGFWPLRRRNPALTDFRAAIAPHAQVRSLPRASDSVVRLGITNAGDETWHAFGRRAVYVAYHWLAADGTIVERDGLRTSLPRDIAPHESITLDCFLRAPELSGELSLVWTLVQEEQAWFDIQNPAACFVARVSVEP